MVRIPIADIIVVSYQTLPDNISRCEDAFVEILG